MSIPVSRRAVIIISLITDSSQRHSVCPELCACAVASSIEPVSMPRISCDYVIHVPHLHGRLGSGSCTCSNLLVLT